ncbi:MAG: acetate--CoA ligase [Acidobacteriota bacterium]|nr:MAG: acetate--CoA ligase [Acidobacteriota bacterium]
MSSLDPILRPRSIAVIGASRKQNSIGWQIMDNLLSHGFDGPIYPVNPNASAIHSVPAYASIKDVPHTVDLAVIVVPKQHVLAVVRESVEAGAKGFVVISAGFREVDGDGVGREKELLELVRAKGLRMVGPNCMGVLNTEVGVSMNATFAPSTPPPGGVAFMSQSGAMGLSILDYAENLGIGISMFVSAGNKADVSGNDLLEYWRDDPETELILLYIESFGNPRKFVDIAQEITRTKPICVVKSGRTGAGARAAASHTGALAQTDLATDAILRQAGAIRAQTVEQLFDYAAAFSNQPLPAGKRIALVTNAGGPGILLADACEANGLEIATLSAGTEQSLRSVLPEEASVKNPVDMIASAGATSYERALDYVLRDPGVDAAIASFVPPLGVHTEDIADALVRANSAHPDKTLLAVLMGQEGLPAGLATLHGADIPAFLFPESAARALGVMWRQKQRQGRPRGNLDKLTADDDAVLRAIQRTRAAGALKLSEADALRVLEAYRIPVTPWRLVDENDAPSAAAELEFPLALKIVSPEIIHKTELGAVRLDIESREELEAAIPQMLEDVRRRFENESPNIDGLLLQRMAPKGQEIIIGLNRMPGVGPMVLFGLGGIYVEALADVALRLCPITDVDADQMIHDVKMIKLLEGFRGAPPRHLEALADALLRVSQLAMRHPEIAEMDINPLISLEDGAVAVDARIQLTDG